MYWKINFNGCYDCIKCCNALIARNFEFTKKNSYSLIIKTDKSYNDILAICVNYYVVSIKKCYIRNWLARWCKNAIRI